MLQPFLFGEFEGRRRVASFGFRYDYDVRQLQRQPTPSRWRNRCKHRDSRKPCNPDSAALCTEYDVGVGVGWHRDKLHFDMIFGLSLNSVCKLISQRGRQGMGDAEPRSLYMTTGASQQIWDHSIPPFNRRDIQLRFAR
jgi:alkylated DNA repair dioxygenase AlkB